jgi:uncharacterized protein YeaO (DUF488 family)
MIFTSNYENAKEGNLVSISMDGGKKAGFNGPWLKELAPNENIYKHWNNAEESDQYYINQYYYQVLKGRYYLLKDLVEKYEGYKKDIILLSYAKPEELSHRYLVASYLEKKFGIVVPELFIDEEGNYLTTTKKPKYVKDKLLRLVQLEER